MRKLLAVMTLLLSTSVSAASNYYGVGLCAYSQYQCIKVQKGQTWETLFPDPVQRDIVQRLNRSYNHLWAGKEIVVPKDLNQKTLLDFAPFPQKIEPEDEKQVIVDQDKLAWAAYDVNGKLVNWGPISSGRDKCSDSNHSCRTMTGIFHFFSKENEKCRSNVFPIGRGGAKMPYCMYFHKGFALHGSDDMPGERASHGCVRLFTQDALWLNHEFVEIANPKINRLGTKVIVRPILATNSGAKK
ncbi:MULTISPECIES: L,D-transpeptidase [Legionella]|uniref:L,D-transpeptidase n=1 Tax=Legionella quinlivanii TaxID=45073 RepID=A0A364LFJ1_9GAMM|nr:MULTISPECIES: L,D-transpeptidase [Legionella]MCE3045821.1 L,D-transpeptidase [Legionella sp. 16cNR16C]RAP34740.1 L,D-transpeptidase [Legionella quinlivanii]